MNRREKLVLYRRKHNIARTKKLSDSYIRDRIRNKFNLYTDQISNELIEWQRTSIIYYRFIGIYKMNKKLRFKIEKEYDGLPKEIIEKIDIPESFINFSQYLEILGKIDSLMIEYSYDNKIKHGLIELAENLRKTVDKKVSVLQAALNTAKTQSNIKIKLPKLLTS